VEKLLQKVVASLLAQLLHEQRQLRDIKQ